jgi:hypothetical protein
MGSVALFEERARYDQDPVATNPLFASCRNILAGGAATTYASTYTGVSTNAPRDFGVNGRYAFGSH